MPVDAFASVPCLGEGRGEIDVLGDSAHRLRVTGSTE
jgi:hypothetical protein